MKRNRRRLVLAVLALAGLTAGAFASATLLGADEVDEALLVELSNIATGGAPPAGPNYMDIVDGPIGNGGQWPIFREGRDEPFEILGMDLNGALDSVGFRGEEPFIMDYGLDGPEGAGDGYGLPQLFPGFRLLPAGGTPQFRLPGGMNGFGFGPQGGFLPAAANLGGFGQFGGNPGGNGFGGGPGGTGPGGNGPGGNGPGNGPTVPGFVPQPGPLPPIAGLPNFVPPIPGKPGPNAPGPNAPGPNAPGPNAGPGPGPTPPAGPGPEQIVPADTPPAVQVPAPGGASLLAVGLLGLLLRRHTRLFGGTAA